MKLRPDLLEWLPDSEAIRTLLGRLRNDYA
jgi:hypothetical protein